MFFNLKELPHAFSFQGVLTSNLIIILLFLVAMGCNEGPAGPSGNDQLTDPTIQPRIIFTYPPQNATGPFNIYNRGEGSALPHFVVRFNKLMNTFSLKEGLVRCEGFDRPIVVRLLRTIIYPLPERIQSTSGDDIYRDLLSFRIYDSLFTYRIMPYSVGQTYTVTIDSGLEDINGNQLRQKYSFSFKPEPAFRIVAEYPEDQSNDNPISFNPYIVFNSLVDDNIFSSLQFFPPINGKWKISSYDSSFVYFKRSADLAFGQAYSLIVQSTARDIFGNQLSQQFRSTFSTVSFKVQYSFPQNGTPRVGLDNSIYILFTGPIDTGTVRAAFSLTPEVGGALVPFDYGFNFFPTSGFSSNTLYTANIASTIRARNGTFLAASYSFLFTTDQFRVISTYPDDGDFNVSRSQSIYVYFNAKIDTGSVRSAFRINPSVPGIFSSFDGSSSFAFIPGTQLAANALYTVTISTLMRTKRGDTLPSTYAFSFITGP